jgi:hypothetical protein
MALGGANRPKPGLKSIYEGREQRKPGGKYGRPSTAVYLAGVSAILASLVAYKFVDDYQMDSAKRDLLAQQRAMKSTIGAEWAPLRGVLEKYVLDSAKAFPGDFVDSEATRWDFRSQPGIYLRMRVADAKDATTLRDAAAESQKDAFTACLLREANQGAARNEPDPPPGADEGVAFSALEKKAFPEQPWNLGKAYAATRVLDDDWAEGLKAADDKMRLRVYQEQYAKAAKVEMKTVAEVVKQAKFFLLVLDEDPDDPMELAKAKQATDAGKLDESSVQLVAHWSRVYVMDLRNKQELLRLRRQGVAGFRFAGEHAPMDPETNAAMQRQVNNCQLANMVRSEIVAKGNDGGAN